MFRLERRLVLCLGLAALMAGWVVANPPFAAPDEWAHYVRAIGVSEGHLVGAKAAYPVPPPGRTEAEASARKYYLWINQATRAVVMPPGTFANNLACNGLKPTVPASCLDFVHVLRTRSLVMTPVGNYEPLPYVLPGLVARQAHGPLAADRAGRVAAGLSALFFLILAVIVSGSASLWRLAGLALAMTPMVLFLGSTLNPSGFEVSTALAFAAALARLSRDPRNARAWAVLGLAGAAVSLSRTPGPLWVVLGAILAAAIWHWPRLPAGYRPRLAAVALVLAAIVANRVYEGLYGSTLPFSLHQSLAYLPHAFSSLSEIWKEEIGVFGSLDSPMPLAAYVTWTATVAVLVIAALIVATRRQRIGLLVSVAVAWVLVPIVFVVSFVPGTSFGVQGRHVLPIWVLVPIFAGEVLARHEWDPARRRLPVATITTLAVVVGAIQFVAFWYNARRQSVGVNGPLNFLSSAHWTPPGGWPLWIAVVAAGAALIAASIAVRAAGSIAVDRTADRTSALPSQ